MTINRENRVKLLKNVGQYLIDHADTLVPTEEPYPTKQNLIVSMDVKAKIPEITFYSQYNAAETLKGIDWSSIT